ncbi:MAG: hypothetical protein AAGU27_06540 [Dehalobacterium sp.]
MTKKTKEDIYLAYLDRILAGETDLGAIEDEEIAKLLVLAKSMIAADFSVESKTRERLKASFSSFRGNDEVSDDELDEEVLDYVAAAGQAGERNHICPYCGAKLNQFQKKCLICGH